MGRSRNNPMPAFQIVVRSPTRPVEISDSNVMIRSMLALGASASPTAKSRTPMTSGAKRIREEDMTCQIEMQRSAIMVVNEAPRDAVNTMAPIQSGKGLNQHNRLNLVVAVVDR